MLAAKESACLQAAEDVKNANKSKTNPFFTKLVYITVATTVVINGVGVLDIIYYPQHQEYGWQFSVIATAIISLFFAAIIGGVFALGYLIFNLPWFSKNIL